MSLNDIIIEPGLQINNQQTIIPNGVVTITNLITTNPNFDPQITENLVETVTNKYDNNSNETSDTELIVEQIRNYAVQIKCENLIFFGVRNLEN